MSEASAAQAKSSTTKPKPSVKPRAITRKSKAEREEYARVEAERSAERATQDTLQTAKVPVSRGRGGIRGGRGGASRTDHSVASAGGIFGTGTGSKPERIRGPADLGQSEALDGDGSSAQPVPVSPSAARDATTSSAARTSASARSRTKTVPEEVSYLEDDEVDEQPRRDIERIWLSSDEEDHAVVARKGKQRKGSRDPRSSGGLRPVRAARVAIEEQETFKTEIKPKIGRSMGSATIIDADGDEMQVDETPMAGPSVNVKRDQPHSPELAKRVLKKSDSSSRQRDPRLLVETTEEKAERLRLNDDTESLRKAFLQKSDSEESADSKEDEAVFGHDRMFLLQLPPLVPQLFDPEAPTAEPAVEERPNEAPVKAEESTEAGAAAATQGSKVVAQPSTAKESNIFTADSPNTQRFPAGYVGKLNVHKSGKVTIDWGGTDMEVRYGTEVDFLQDVVRVDTPKAQLVAPDAPPVSKEGQAYALGQAKRKMVLVPDWSKLYA